jgi:hypothetical protein
MFDQAMLQYQFVLTDAAGKVIGRTPVYGDVTSSRAGGEPEDSPTLGPQHLERQESASPTQLPHHSFSI